MVRAMAGCRILIYGNAGSGKSTMARREALARGIPHLDLDAITWGAVAVRRPLAESLALLDGYVAAHPDWVIEGCYGDLVEAALPRATELRFLNPGVEACVANCRRRPWEPSKFATREAQDAMLEGLLAWVREYDARADEYGLARHRAIFDAFEGSKREHGAPPVP
jgi:adenylate kinase family enzyme